MSLNAGRIVVVEDEPDIQDIISYNLQREGFEVDTYDNGHTGLQAITEQQPDTVILDLMLPGKDGLEVCQELRANETTKSLPIIMVTAKGEESDIVLGWVGAMTT